MDYFFGTDPPASTSSLSSRHASDAALDAAADDAAGMEQRRLMMALHTERERLAADQLAIDAKWESAEFEKKRLQEHLTNTSRKLEDTRTQLADQERFLRGQHAAEARRRKDLLNQMGEVKLHDVNLAHESQVDAMVNERQKKEKEMLLMAQSVDAARTKQRGAEREADDMHGEANEARQRAFEIQRQLDDMESERSQSSAAARRYRASAAAESVAKTAALSEVDLLRRQLAEAERRSTPSHVAAEADTRALAMYREKLGPAPTDPEHSSQLVARDAVESRLSAASVNSDLMGEVAAMASRRERVKMKHDLALMETMTQGLEDEVMRVQADGQALATSLQRELTNQVQLKETAQAEASKFKDQARALAHALNKLKEASYELESGMTGAATRAKERLRAIIDAILPAFDHHANLQLSGEETEEVFAAAVEDLGTATMALRHGRDELLSEMKAANDSSRSATVAMEQTRDQTSMTNSKLTQRIQGQADDIRSLQEARVLDRAEWARERAELEQEFERLKASTDRVEDNAMRAAEKDEDRLKRAREELRLVQQTNTRLQAELAGYRPAAAAAAGGGGGKNLFGSSGGGSSGELNGGGGGGGAGVVMDDAPLPGWADLQELKRDLASAGERADNAEARAAAAEAALEESNARSVAAAKQAWRRVARTGSGASTPTANSPSKAGPSSGGGGSGSGGVWTLLDAQALRDELQGVTERLMLVTEDNTRLKTERVKVKADLALDRAKTTLEARGMSKTFSSSAFEVADTSGEAAKVQQLERDKAAIMARAEAAEKRHKNLLQEKRVFIGD